jgi:predicted glycosyltransferase
MVAPLNWGLGHATRCIPIIKCLEKWGASVLLASDGVALHLLQAEFPHLPYVQLPSYQIQYSSHNMVRNIARQLPRIMYAIRAEHQFTVKIAQEQGIQGIISDNRYGCFDKKVSSVLLTHQLNLRVPNAVLQWTANRMLRRAISRFDEVWTPDTEHSPNLSGELSHPAKGIGKIRYIGLLSRATIAEPFADPDYDVAVVLSGPEPQRTYLEQILLELPPLAIKIMAS